MSIVDEIFELFAAKGSAAYFGEQVSQSEHALQAAYLAESEGAAGSLIAAALLHDIGHLVHGLPELVADQGLDARHEDAGHIWLGRHFGPEVTEPVRLHVAAKRYLCRVDPDYLSRLSAASIQSLELQGGPFDDVEAQQFEKSPYHHDATRLRRWDDAAKVPGLTVPDFEHYRGAIQTSLRRNAGR